MKDIIKENIPYFKNITIRKDFGLNIQLSNVILIIYRNSKITNKISKI